MSDARVAVTGPAHKTRTLIVDILVEDLSWVSVLTLRFVALPELIIILHYTFKPINPYRLCYMRDLRYKPLQGQERIWKMIGTEVRILRLGKNSWSYKDFGKRHMRYGPLHSSTKPRFLRRYLARPLQVSTHWLPDLAAELPSSQRCMNGKKQCSLWRSRSTRTLWPSHLRIQIFGLFHKGLNKERFFHTMATVGVSQKKALPLWAREVI